MIIEFLSPSKVHYIAECKLRYYLSFNGSLLGIRKYFRKESFLGILLHSVLEKYLKNNKTSKNFEAIWKDVWNEKIDEYNLRNWDLSELKYHLPFYIIKKRKLQYMLENTDWKRNGYDLKSEKFLYKGIVRGYADIVYENKRLKKVRIVDFKSGTVSYFEDGERKGLYPKYREQLITYGYVYWKKGFRSENIICEILNFSQKENEAFTFSDEQYRIHERHLYALKTEINNAVRGNRIKDLANPNADVCRTCDQVDRCEAVHEKIMSGLNIRTICVLENSNVEIKDRENRIAMRSVDGSRSIRNIPTDQIYQIKEVLRSNRRVFISGLYEDVNSTAKYWNRHTSLKILNTI